MAGLKHVRRKAAATICPRLAAVTIARRTDPSLRLVAPSPPVRGRPITRRALLNPCGADRQLPCPHAGVGRRAASEILSRRTQWDHIDACGQGLDAVSQVL